MKPMRSKLTLAAFALLSVCAPAVFAESKAPLAVGSPAPDFTLSAQDGKPVNLHDFHGKWVVLYFYPKDFTSGCSLEAHNFQRDQALYDQHNAVILGVSVQDEKSHQEFCVKEGLHFKLLADTKHEVSEKYDSVMNVVVTKISKRHTFLIDPSGVLRKIYNDVSPSKHSDEVLAELTTLQANK
jgi:peroxiredoxin Q/BCP